MGKRAIGDFPRGGGALRVALQVPQWGRRAGGAGWSGAVGLLELLGERGLPAGVCGPVVPCACLVLVTHGARSRILNLIFLPGHYELYRGSISLCRQVSGARRVNGPLTGGSNYDSLKVSQMPRHLISDAHEWINEIPTVLTYYLANPQAGERACTQQRGKKTLLSLTLV